MKLLLGDNRVSPQEQHNAPLWYAASNGHLEIVKLLVADRRVTPSACGNRALISAREKDHREIAKVLVQSSATSTADNDKLWNWAFSSGYFDTLKQLVRCGKFPSQDCATKILQESCKQGNIAVTRLMLTDPRISLCSSFLPIMLASRRGDNEMVKLLLDDERFLSGSDLAVKEAHEKAFWDIMVVLLSNEKIVTSLPSILLLLQTKNRSLN